MAQVHYVDIQSDFAHAIHAEPVQPITHAVFDNDSLLIRSEALAMRVMDTEGTSLVKAIKPDADIKADYIYHGFSGVQTSQIVEALIKEFDLPVEDIISQYSLDDFKSETGTDARRTEVAEKIAEAITEKTIEVLGSDQLKIVPHIPEALTEVDKRLPNGAESKALCTTSPEERMDASVDAAVDEATGKKAGLDSIFPAGDKRVSGYDVANKYEKFQGIHPDADDFPPETTAVYEDSTSSAKKAATLGHPVVGSIADFDFYPGEKGLQQAGKLLENGARVIVSNARDFALAIDWFNAGMAEDKMPEFHADIWVPSPQVPTRQLV